MRPFFNVLFAVFFISLSAEGQHFTQIMEGEVVNTPSDSRSVNFVDVNDDGFPDLFISNGPSGGQNNLLYLNDQQGGFTAVLNDPAVQDGGASDGVTFADADNDGDLDLYVTTWYNTFNHFFEGLGNGDFTEQSSNGTVPTTSFAETASWGDFDNDGFLDLYVSNSAGNKRNWLFHNEGNGLFTQIDTATVVTEFLSSRSVQWIDYDLDHDLDLFVSNEGIARNSLFRNEGNGYLKKITGLAITDDFANSMGSSWADVDNDLDLDLFVANYDQNNQLFLNDGTGQFTEVDAGDLTNDGGCSFGSSFGDFDNDGDLDLVVANSFCTGDLDNFVYRNLGNGQFERVDTTAINAISGWSFGLAWADYDQNGFLDLAIANCQNGTQVNSLFRNEGNSNHWLHVDVVGTISNRSAIGLKIYAKATINGEERWQFREISAQDGYCSQNSLAIHFGLGDASQVDSLVLVWPSGIEMILTNEAVNQRISIIESGSNAISSVNLETDWQVFPNPAKGQIRVTFSQTTGSQQAIRLWDSNGKQYAHYHLPEGKKELQLDLPNLVPGWYVLEFQGPGKHDSIPLFIQP
ncbi:MAG: FG-GAP-like repeat-containing protein [Bacteroidota bacterium]